MAENVLGMLFGEIAEAIRSKTGDTATMKPAEFPEEIGSIEVGGKTYRFTRNYAKPTKSTELTITHYCGVVPDIVFIYAAGVPGTGYFQFCIGYSKAMLAAMKGADLGSMSYGVSSSTSSSSGRDTNGIDADTNDSVYTEYGGVRNATSSQFTIGGTKAKLDTNKYYHYMLIYGLT